MAYLHVKIFLEGRNRASTKMQMFDTMTVLFPLTNENCELSEQLSHNRFNFWCYIAQLILSFISLTATAYLFCSHEFKRLGSLLSKNLKSLVFVGWLIYFTGVLSTTIFYSCVTFYSLRYYTDCGHVWIAWRCLIFRILIHYSIVGLSIFHVLVTIERLYSLYIGTDKRTIWGIVLALIALIFPCIIVLYMYRNEQVENAYKIYCFASKDSIETLTDVTNLLGVIDILSMLTDLALYKYNQVLIKRKTHNYNLEKSFQLRERELSIKMIIPMSILHTIVFIPFVVTYFMNQSFEGEARVEYLEVTFLIKSVYNMVIPLAIIYFQNRGRDNNTKIEWLQPSNNLMCQHFQQLNAWFEMKRLG